MTSHECIWGPVERARLTSTPHRKCQVPGCREITLDIDEEEPTITEPEEGDYVT